MREIKFRAWRPSYGIYLDWSTMKQSAFNKEQYSLIHTVFTATDEDYILEQYTGLKDKNGVEIYEGDIVKICGDLEEYDPFGDGEFELEEKHFELTCSVEWCGIYTGFNLKTITSNGVCGGWSLCSEDDALDIEVIGNIHEAK